MGTWVVRHACAGHKGEGGGPDDDRPLDPAGEEQAAALVAVLAGTRPRRLLASPTRRCVATLAPLGRALGLAVEDAPALRSASGEELVALVADPDLDGAVLCTHGEVMEPALAVLRAQGLEVVAAADLLLKGAAWHLERGAAGWRLELRAPVPVTACPHHP